MVPACDKASLKLPFVLHKVCSRKWHESSAQMACSPPCFQRPPPEDTPNPISVFRAAWQEVSDSYTVHIPPIQDDRALQSESLAMLLANAGFTSLLVESFAVSKPMTVDEATGFLLSTYLPDLLPPAGFAQLTRMLKAELAELDGGTGTVTLVEHSDLVTARRR